MGQVYRLALYHTVTRIAIAKAIEPFGWVMIVDHRLCGRGRFIHFDAVLVVITIDSGIIISHGLWACAFPSVFVQMICCIT